ncbi:hypothetical protein PUN28_017347 [Cardiocondyla obscurior]|uniref:Secreted protein n=1 Tax=Cardiocondyla obscurior TaxID=286306 RepID=A0AAW2EQP0_9HYME
MYSKMHSVITYVLSIYLFLSRRVDVPINLFLLIKYSICTRLTKMPRDNYRHRPSKKKKKKRMQDKVTIYKSELMHLTVYRRAVVSKIKYFPSHVDVRRCRSNSASFA